MLSEQKIDARTVLSRAFAASEFNRTLEDHMFAGERADEGERLADVALAALRAAGYSVVRQHADDDMTSEQFDRAMAEGTPVSVSVNLIRPPAGPDYPL